MVNKETQAQLEAAGWKGEASTDRLLEALPTAQRFEGTGEKGPKYYLHILKVVVGYCAVYKTTPPPIGQGKVIYETQPYPTPAEALAALWLELRKQKIL